MLSTAALSKAIVRLSGDLNSARTAWALRGVDTDVAIVDFTDVQFIDGGALGALVALKKRLRARGHLGIVSVVVPNPRFRRLFEMTGLDKVFQVYPTMPRTETT
jgi:anti-sigma B factor antagonist